MAEPLNMLPQYLREIQVKERFALDIASVVAGIRKRGLIHIPITKKESIYEILRKYNLYTPAERHLFSYQDPHSMEWILEENKPGNIISEDWIEIWYSNTPDNDNLNFFKNTGEILGYPKCCVDAMNKVRSLSRFYETYLLDDAPRFWQLNRLNTLFGGTFLMPDFFPCSLSCKEAKAFADNFVKLSFEVFGEETEITCNIQKQPIFLHGDYIYTCEKWRADEEKLYIEAASLKKQLLSKITKLDNYTGGFKLLSCTHFKSKIEEVVFQDSQGEVISSVSIPQD